MKITLEVEVNREGHAVRTLEQFYEDFVGDGPKCYKCGVDAVEEEEE